MSEVRRVILEWHGTDGFCLIGMQGGRGNEEWRKIERTSENGRFIPILDQEGLLVFGVWLLLLFFGFFFGFFFNCFVCNVADKVGSVSDNHGAECNGCGRN